jgi:hypothetical protein
MVATFANLRYLSVHPYQFLYKEILARQEQKAMLFPDVDRQAYLYEHMDGDFRVFVSFQRGDDTGVNKVPSYEAWLGGPESVANLTDAEDLLKSAGDAVERTWRGELLRVFGEPA